MKYLSMDELKTLLRSLPEDKPWQRTMFLVAFWHGLRISELVGREAGGRGEYGLKGKDIQHGYVDVSRLKKSLHTVQKYATHDDPELDESIPLRALAAQVGHNDPVFPISVRGVQDLMKRVSKRSGLNWYKMHPHILKHTLAMQLIKGGLGIETVRANLGHKSLSSTGFYLHISQDDAMDAAVKVIR
jgi:site-specific recombinase XerD